MFWLCTSPPYFCDHRSLVCSPFGSPCLPGTTWYSWRLQPKTLVVWSRPSWTWWTGSCRVQGCGLLGRAWGRSPLSERQSGRGRLAVLHLAASSTRDSGHMSSPPVSLTPQEIRPPNPQRIICFFWKEEKLTTHHWWKGRPVGETQN